MKPETLALLKAADYSNWCESPPDFDWDVEMARVRQLQPRIEKLLARPVLLDESVQDASFFAQLLCVHFSIIFSAFGNFFTVWSETELDKDLEKIIVAVAESEDLFTCLTTNSEKLTQASMRISTDLIHQGVALGIIVILNTFK